MTHRKQKDKGRRIEIEDNHSAEESTVAPDDAQGEQMQPQQASRQIKAEAEDQPQTPRQQLESLQGELADTSNRMLRVQADYQNFVRRSQKNLNEARQQQLMEIAKALVTVLDHFDRALEIDTQKTTATSLVAGVKIVRDELLRTLERFGVERVDVKVGDEFDPNRHEALMHEAGEDVQANHVVKQLQPGYILGDKTLRPAQVSIAQ